MIEVVVGDLAFVDTDAVVRPATATLEPTASALRNLERIGGSNFLDQLVTNEPLAVGSATVTGGGDLPSEFVIHAIIRSPSEPVSAAGVRQAIISSLHRADAWKFESLAFPPVGIGPGNLSIESVAQIMHGVLTGHAATGTPPNVIKIVVETDADKAAFDGLFKE